MVLVRPPPMGCLLTRLVADYGDEWVRHSHERYPQLMIRVLAEARANKSCADQLTRLFPDGLPDLPPEDKSTDLEKLLERIREDEGH